MLEGWTATEMCSPAEDLHAGGTQSCSHCRRDVLHLQVLPLRVATDRYICFTWHAGMLTLYCKGPHTCGVTLRQRMSLFWKASCETLSICVRLSLLSSHAVHKRLRPARCLGCEVCVMWHVDPAPVNDSVAACLMFNLPCVTPSKRLHKPKMHAGGKTLNGAKTHCGAKNSAHNCQTTKPFSIALHHAGSADTFERAFSWRKCALRELLAKMHWAPDLYKMCHECLHSFCGMLRHCSSMQHASKVESVDASVLVLGGCALIMHKTGSYPALLRWLQKYIKVAFALCYAPVLLCPSTLIYSLSTHITSHYASLPASMPGTECC